MVSTSCNFPLCKNWSNPMCALFVCLWHGGCELLLISQNMLATHCFCCMLMLCSRKIRSSYSNILTLMKKFDWPVARYGEQPIKFLHWSWFSRETWWIVTLDWLLVTLKRETGTYLGTDVDANSNTFCYYDAVYFRLESCLWLGMKRLLICTKFGCDSTHL